MTRHLVLGNGESRAWFNPSEKSTFQWKKSNDITTWGCNAIYRDGHVDNLVSIDYGIQQEIYQSGYHKWSQCWFLDWNPVPAEIADMMLMGQDISESDIHKTERTGNHTEQCVIAGTDPTKPHKKDEKDVGIWKGYKPLIWDREPTVEEITRNLWDHLSEKIPSLIGVSLVESSEFDRCRKVSLTKN